MRRVPFLAASLLAAVAAASCTSTQDVLEPSAIAAAPPADSPLPPEIVAGAAAPQVASVSTTVAAPVAAVATRTRLRFDPLVGTSVDAATPLTERLGTQAKARGFGLAGSADPSATHVLKGYFSTITEGRATTVIYVWDIYDPAGNRLHRINGQQQTPSSSAEGWQAVPAATMQTIADTTIDQLAAWLAGRAS